MTHDQSGLQIITGKRKTFSQLNLFIFTLRTRPRPPFCVLEDNAKEIVNTCLFCVGLS